MTVEDPELCPRFSVRVFTDVQVGPSPLWLKARLMAAGQRPISNVVDITNYVMLLLGQPMHAYDLDRVAGPALHVRRRARASGSRRSTASCACSTPTPCWSATPTGPPASAGSWAAPRSEVSDATTRVAMEAATWNGANILQTSKKLGLRTEASTRFEKQLHPELALRAQRAGGAADGRAVRRADGSRHGRRGGAEPPPRRDPAAHRARRASCSGERIEPRGVRARSSRRLGFGVSAGDDDLEVEVPYFRHGDVSARPT